MGRPLIDLTGQKFGRYTVLRYLRREHHSSLWICECACGTQREVMSVALKSGTTKSCGCHRAERMARLNYKHGGKGTPEFKVWDGILQRCLNPKTKNFKDYGGRGITIAPEWRTDFAAFFAHIGPRPSRAHTLDRIDNSRGYEPGNLRWATSKEQHRNKRSNRIVRYQGRDMTMAEACERSGFAKHVIMKRLNSGWGFDRAFSEPLHWEKSHAR